MLSDTLKYLCEAWWLEPNSSFFKRVVEHTCLKWFLSIFYAELIFTITFHSTNHRKNSFFSLNGLSYFLSTKFYNQLPTISYIIWFLFYYFNTNEKKDWFRSKYFLGLIIRMQCKMSFIIKCLEIRNERRSRQETNVFIDLWTGKCRCKWRSFFDHVIGSSTTALNLYYVTSTGRKFSFLFCNNDPSCTLSKL